MKDYSVLLTCGETAMVIMHDAYDKGYEQGYKDGQSEQKPKIGHWIMTNDYYTGAYKTIPYVKCSYCREDSLEEGDYCPNCGAKMVEPQESEDKE